MAGLGWQELVIVLVIIMIIFGAGKLPEIAKSLGQGVKEFREESQAPIVPASTRATAATDVVADRVDDAVDGARTDAARAETVAREAI